MDYLEVLREKGIDRSSDYPDESFLIRGLWRTDLLFQPNPAERTFKYVFLLVQTVAEGACYCSTIPVLEEGYYLLGEDSREVDFKYRCFEVATVDAMYSAFEKHPDETLTMTGSSAEKALWRSRIIVNETARLLELEGIEGGCVVNVGVIGNVVRMLAERGMDVIGTDEDPLIVGAELEGVPIYGEERTVEMVEKCDAAIMTGMIISTETMGEIMEAAKRTGTKLIMFCETGANLCEEYVKLGVDAAIAEPFPFYIFGGTTRIDVYRRK
ncbi:MAG: hypothetical protein GF400_03790 [Candidatus Eisenbacteria bacterium]|nr:hypothetical protein [Candidatus Eisenbacteria bacterium]